MPSSTRDKIRAEHPDAWIAVNPGDRLNGQVIDLDSAWSDVRNGGSFYPLLTVRVTEAEGYDQGAELKVHAFGAVLFNEIMKRRPQVGDRIIITYAGTSARTPPKGQSAPEIYRVSMPDRPVDANTIYDKIEIAPHLTPAGPPPVREASPAADQDIPF